MFEIPVIEESANWKNYLWTHEIVLLSTGFHSASRFYHVYLFIRARFTNTSCFSPLPLIHRFIFFYSSTNKKLFKLLFLSG